MLGFLADFGDTVAGEVSMFYEDTTLVIVLFYFSNCNEM